MMKFASELTTEQFWKVFQAAVAAEDPGRFEEDPPRILQNRLAIDYGENEIVAKIRFSDGSEHEFRMDDFSFDYDGENQKSLNVSAERAHRDFIRAMARIFGVEYVDSFLREEYGLKILIGTELRFS